jgi:hypothetical protein
MSANTIIVMMNVKVEQQVYANPFPCQGFKKSNNEKSSSLFLIVIGILVVQCALATHFSVFLNENRFKLPHFATSCFVRYVGMCTTETNGKNRFSIKREYYGKIQFEMIYSCFEQNVITISLVPLLWHANANNNMKKLFHFMRYGQRQSCCAHLSLLSHIVSVVLYLCISCYLLLVHMDHTCKMLPLADNVFVLIVYSMRSQTTMNEENPNGILLKSMFLP